MGHAESDGATMRDEERRRERVYTRERHQATRHDHRRKHAERARDAEVSKAALLAAAEDIFARDGFEGARVESEIAEVAGWRAAKVKVYWHEDVNQGGRRRSANGSRSSRRREEPLAEGLRRLVKTDADRRVRQRAQKRSLLVEQGHTLASVGRRLEMKPDRVRIGQRRYAVEGRAGGCWIAPGVGDRQRSTRRRARSWERRWSRGRRPMVCQ